MIILLATARRILLFDVVLVDKISSHEHGAEEHHVEHIVRARSRDHYLLFILHHNRRAIGQATHELFHTGGIDSIDLEDLLVLR